MTDGEHKGRDLSDGEVRDLLKELRGHHAFAFVRALAEEVTRLRFEQELMLPVIKAATEFIASDDRSKVEQWHELRNALGKAKERIAAADAAAVIS